MDKAASNPHPFLSHSGDDDACVTELASRLEEAGINVWADHLGGVIPSDDLFREVQKGLNVCNMTLLALSRSSAQKDAVWNESLQTRRLGKRLYVALIEEIPPEEFPWFLNTTLYVDLYSDFDSGFDQLVQAMRLNRGLDANHILVDVKRKRTSRGATDPRFYLRMYGRDDDVAKVETLLRNGRPTFITGIGGIGKSRLAHEVALRATDVTGVIWHQCSEVSNATEITDLLKEHFALPPSTQQSIVESQIMAQRLLVVVDNAESVQDTEKRSAYVDLSNLITQLGSQVLFTSREAWNYRWGLQFHHMGELPVTAAREICQSMSESAQVDLSREDSQSLADSAIHHPRLIELAVIMCRTTAYERVVASLAELRSRPIEDALDEMLTNCLMIWNERNLKLGHWPPRY